ncbi:hypothetical protein FHW58_003595 [Duganella sp. 1224]|uniref:hypothetical protein n=1 Tax=Duganella sp. 1224 TaxID=2587052 RepID=UPI0015C73D49|nr:hypothetical protein [Duganella sp. 1224]NYE62380.1 hypothetical protein [Duganella sp. 1224]
MKMQWLLGALLCAASVGAQAQLEERVTIPAPRLTIDLPQQVYRMNSAELREFRGSYTLSDGRILRLRGNDHAMYGEVGNEGAHRLVAANRNTFVALDRKLKVRIDLDDNGEAGGEVLMAVPMRLAAGGEVEDVVVRLAAR